MVYLKLCLWIMWFAAFIAWIVFTVLNVKSRDKTNHMLICSTIMLVISIINILI